MDQPQASTDELVRQFLRGQNLEQLGRIEEAIGLYENVVKLGFDSSGPYDRLIFIFEERRMHSEVIRVAEESLRNVRTYPLKQTWYLERIEKAKEALGSAPKPL